MNIEILNRFILLARMEPISFSQAAEKLHIPQPHLSSQIKKLEKELEIELFDRKKHPSTLTLAGRHFLESIYHLPAQLEYAKISARQVFRGEAGSIRIGINTSASNSIFPKIFLKFSATFPLTTAILHEAGSYQQILQIKERQLDVGLFHLDNISALEEEIECRSFLEERLIVALPEGHPTSKSLSINIEDLRNETFILPSPIIAGLRSKVIALCQSNGFSPRVKQEAAWITTFLSLVACNLGVAILPENTKNLQRPGVIYRPIQGESPRLQLGVVWRKNDANPVLQNFLTTLEQATIEG